MFNQISKNYPLGLMKNIGPLKFPSRSLISAKYINSGVYNRLKLKVHILPETLHIFLHQQ